MGKKNLSSNNSSIKGLMKTWEKIWADVNELNPEVVLTLQTLLLVNQKAKCNNLFKLFEKLKADCCKFYDELEAADGEAVSVPPVDVKLPWDTPKFKKEWTNWKEYLLEQHGIKISSRTEEKQLANLYILAEKDENKAYTMIDYSISSFYRTHFKLDAKEKKEAQEQGIKKNENDY